MFKVENATGTFESWDTCANEKVKIKGEYDFDFVFGLSDVPSVKWGENVYIFLYLSF